MASPLNAEYMGENVKEKLKKCGEEVTIHPLAKIVRPEVIEIGYHSSIDDFVFLFGGKGIAIGSYVHIPCFCSVIGGGELVMGDCSTLTAGVRIITGTDNYYGGTFMSASCLSHWRNATTGKIIIGPGAFIGTNSVVMPDVTIGESAVVGALSFVNKDLEPYGVYVGTPARKIGTRDDINAKILAEINEAGVTALAGRSRSTP